MKKNNKLKIIGIRSSGYRMVDCIELMPSESGITVFQGDNGEGKTAFVESIEYVFNKKKNIPDLVNDAHKKLDVEIKLSNGLSYRKTKTEKGNATLVIKDKDGILPKETHGQDYASSLWSPFSFNPLSFYVMKLKEQLGLLMSHAGVDFSEIDKEISSLVEDRKIIKREITAIGKPETKDLLPIENDIKTLRLSLKDADVLNTDIDLEYNIAYRVEVGKVNDHNEEVRLADKKNKDRDNSIDEIKINIEEIEAKIDVLKLSLISKKHSLEVLTKEKPEVVNKPLRIEDIDIKKPKKVKVSEILEKIESCDKVEIENLSIKAENQKVEDINDKKSKIDTINNKITLKQSSKNFELSKMSLVPGLEVKEVDGKLEIFFDNSRLSRLSNSERVIVSAEIGMSLAKDGQVGTLFVDNGEMLGKGMFNILQDWAVEKDIQVLMTRVFYGDEPPATKENEYTICEGNILSAKKAGKSLLSRYKTKAVRKPVEGDSSKFAASAEEFDVIDNTTTVGEEIIEVPEVEESQVVTKETESTDDIDDMW